MKTQTSYNWVTDSLGGGVVIKLKINFCKLKIKNFKKTNYTENWLEILIPHTMYNGWPLAGEKLSTGQKVGEMGTVGRFV